VEGDRWDVCYCDRWSRIAWVAGAGAVLCFGVEGRTLGAELSGLGCFFGGRSNSIYFYWGIDLESKACSLE
jgi:hypothetical protein